MKQHPEELAAAILQSFGFVWKAHPFHTHISLYPEAWTHPRSNGKFYWHVLTAERAAEALIEMGHEEFRRRAADVLHSIDMDRDGGDE